MCPCGAVWPKTWQECSSCGEVEFGKFDCVGLPWGSSPGGLAKSLALAGSESSRDASASSHKKLCQCVDFDCPIHEEHECRAEIREGNPGSPQSTRIATFAFHVISSSRAGASRIPLRCSADVGVAACSGASAAARFAGSNKAMIGILARDSLHALAGC